MAAIPSDVPHRFDPVIPSEQLAALRRKLEAALADGLPPAPFEGSKARFGLTHERFLQLHRAWIDYLAPAPAKGFEDDTWAAYQAHLRTFAHFTLQVEDVKLHFVRERPGAVEESSGRKVVPLLLLHGWPGHMMEFSKVIKPLAHPGASAPLGVPAFDVVAPSHPGYLWSSYFSAHESKISGRARGNHSGPDGDLLVSDVARIMDKLMCALGYGERGYAVQAGDWGSMVARRMAVLFPQRCKAVHLNFCPAPPPQLRPLLPLRLAGSLFVPSRIHAALHALPRNVPRAWYTAPAPLGPLGGAVQGVAHALIGSPSALTPRERQYVARGIEFQTSGSAYAAFHGTRPATLGLVMHANPLALLAWIGEKFLAWTDQDPEDSEILASLTMWYCTDTMARSLYPYRNRPPLGVQAVIAQPENYIHVPTGYSNAPLEIMPTPKEWVASTCNLKWHREHTDGGHFFAMEKPDRFVRDMQDCFGKIWK